MANEAKYKHIEDDSKVSAIGSLFRGVNNKLWAINLDFSGKQSKSIQFSAVSILARRRVLNSTGRHKKSGLPHRLTISNSQTWQIARLKDCPAYKKAPRGRDYDQFCFVVEDGGKKVFIPQLELARVLFYHDPFLARLSLQHNALAEDFFVDLDNDNPMIYVREGAEYPVYYFNRDDNRRFLSWVLMDAEARKSFESISASLITNQIRKNSYDHWDFSFTPPPLVGVTLEMTGWDERDSGTFFVWEINEVSNIPSSIEGDVDFYHPKYERQVGGKPTSGKGSKGESPEQFELDDTELSDTDKATIELASDKVKTSFNSPFITNRVANKTRSVNSTTGDGDNEVLGKDLSANEKEVTGNLPGGAWNNLDDQTEDAHLYFSKFRSFMDAVNLLETQHKFKIVKTKIEKLPRLATSKKNLHWLRDTQNPRCIAIVELEYHGQSITLLEIDTSDDAAKLSTLMMKIGISGWLLNNLDRILKGIMKKSLGWPTIIFEERLRSEDFDGIPHPRSKHSGRLKSEEIGPWAQRFFNWISR
ncbi:MAG: Tn7-like element transposition protein TnsE [Pseudomonadales bacterium]|nr:Tn7-like element transposition protein TnsE [Pseudomonadales bacterium]